MSATSQPTARSPFAITLWILISTLMSAGGWVLSALHQLNAKGYAVWMLISAAALLWWEKNRGFADLKGINTHLLLRRFKRPLPLGFLLLATLAFAGGLLFAPVNYDGLAYRVPRVMHWLAHGQWLWVHSEFYRLNDRACGMEWLTAPVLALTGGIRSFFLVSIISYLLLPGLLFSVFTRFGAKRKVAWHWMWIVATGYGYVTQAGSIANDLLGAVYVLATFDFALRLRQSRRAQDFWLFIFACALMTGSKASNLPLLLPLFLIIMPTWDVLLARPIKSFAVIAVATLASFLPTAVMNYRHCGDWTGMKLEGPLVSPPFQLICNSGIWLMHNIFPPVCPVTGWWDNSVASKVSKTFGVFPGVLDISQMQVEEGAGLGMGVCLLLIISLLASRQLRNSITGANPTTSAWWKLIIWSPFISLIVFGLKAQVVASSARLLIPYYAILVVPFLLHLRPELFRRRWWQCLVGLVFAMSALLLIISPARPLWPAQSVLARLKASHPSSALILRAEKVYSVYAGRANAFTPAVEALPPDAKVVGFMTFDDPETSLWWPWGSRRIEHVMAEDSRESIDARGIKYVLIPSQGVALRGTVEDILKKLDAEIIRTVPLQLRAGQGPMDWYIIRLRPARKAAIV